jgi:hypothetical protein
MKLEDAIVPVKAVMGLSYLRKYSHFGPSRKLMFLKKKVWSSFLTHTLLKSSPFSLFLESAEANKKNN